MPTSKSRSAPARAAVPGRGWRTGRRAGIPAWLMALLGFVIVFGVLAVAQAVFMPFALAVLLTFLLSPIVTFFQKHGIHRVVSVLIVCLFAVGVIGGVAYVVGVQVVALGHELPLYRDNIRQKVADVRWLGRGSSIEKLQETVEKAVEEVKKTEQTKPAAAPPVPVTIQEPASNQLWRNLASIGPWLEPLGSLALVVVLVPFMLLERQELRNRLIRLIGSSKLAITTKALDEASVRVTRYLLMQTVVNTTFGASVALGLWALGVPYALLFGLLATVLRFIPYVGPWLAALFPITVSLAVFPGWTTPLMVIGLFLVLELFSNMVMETLLYANTAGVSEVALLVAVAFWTWLWGPIGLMLATPLTVCLVVFAKYVPDLQFITVMMTAEDAIPPAAAFYQRLLAQDEDEASDIVEEYAKTHPIESVYDDILVPALVLARRDRLRGQLSPDEERYIIAATRELLDRLHDTVLRVATARDEGRAPATAPAAGVLRVLGCPARDEADEVSLLMFRDLLDPTRAELHVVSSVMLSSEVVSLVAEETPGVVLIAALPPGGLAQVRYLCKRLRARFCDVPIVVGRWCDEEGEAVRRALTEAGATDVGFTLVDTRRLVLQFSQVSTDLQPDRAA